MTPNAGIRISKHARERARERFDDLDMEPVDLLFTVISKGAIRPHGEGFLAEFATDGHDLAAVLKADDLGNGLAVVTVYNRGRV